jgi:mono/diheme cytochrome c family protein
MRGKAVLLCLGALALSACRQDMHNQPRYDPLQASNFFADKRSARPQIEGTVARNQLRLDSKLYRGMQGQEPVDTIPVPVTKAMLQRGQDRYNVFCTPCHGRLGDGMGMVVQRGYRQPPSFHIERLIQESPGHYFDVITNGFGAMPRYGYRVAAEDRWAIIAYIRALQLSQNATINDVPAEHRQELQ